MNGWSWVLFWWLAFAVTHIGLSSHGVRPWLVGRLGERVFQGIYSLVALAIFILLILAYSSNKHTGPLLWHPTAIPGIYGLGVILATLGIAIVTASIVQPSPMALQPGIQPSPRGLTRITRHPLFMGLALWGLSHALLYGFLSDVIFFGGFFVFALIGGAHQDVRLRKTEKHLVAFYQETSFWPFAAILSGRGRLVISELPWIGLAAGLGVAMLLYYLHPWLFS